MIVIPMAGLSRRFSDAGYTLPKYMLPLHGKSVFAHSINSFAALFHNTSFLFIARRIADTEAFLRRECSSLGLTNSRFAMLDRETGGQAETVELGLNALAVVEDEPITIFNIDTFRAGFTFPEDGWFPTSDGYLEVFRGSGTNWSYVGPVIGAQEPLVATTTEKRPISDLCCDGLYHFARAGDFRHALEKERSSSSLPELYVAPLYNHLISAGQRIHYNLVPAEKITFCGIPAEYELARSRITS